MHNTQFIVHNLISLIPYFRQIMRLVGTWRAMSDIIFQQYEQKILDKKGMEARSVYI